MNRKTTRAALVAVLSLTLAITGGALATAHTMEGGKTHAAPKRMKVSIKIKQDAMAGHNLFIKTRAFRWAPEHASGKHVKGEGHAHLLIDGKPVTRIYGPAYFVHGLASGTHKIEVTLNGNDHVGYVRGHKAITDTATFTVK